MAAISVSAGTWHSLEVTVAPMSVPRGHLLDYAARFKEHLRIPVIAVGRLDDPALAERVVAEGKADVVLLGRGLLADPDWGTRFGTAEPPTSARASRATPASTSSGEAWISVARSTRRPAGNRPGRCRGRSVHGR